METLTLKKTCGSINKLNFEHPRPDLNDDVDNVYNCSVSNVKKDEEILYQSIEYHKYKLAFIFMYLLIYYLIF